MAGENSHILVVDDEKGICEFIKGYLEQEKLAERIVLANNAKVALQKIRNEDFNLVIVDYYMPDQEGIQLIETIRKSCKYEGLDFLMISGKMDAVNLSEAIKQGIRHVLVKPFTGSELAERVSQILAAQPPKGSHCVLTI